MSKKEILFKEAAAAYPFSCKIVDITPYGGGHINDTFLVTCTDGEEYVLQHINSYVFKHPDEIMENIMGVTKFIADKLTAEGKDPSRRTLTIIPTSEGKSFYVDTDGEFWRVSLNINNTTAYDYAESAEMFKTSGAAFGEFQSMLADYPAETLHETIPHFHDTPDRFRQLEDAIRENKSGRLENVAAEIEFANARREDCALLMNLLNAGKLPLKVTHNDTKMSNVLIDNETGDAVCVIDLDTVMPGLTAFDYGDSIRAGATTAAEDEVDLSKVHFDLDLFKAYTEGFLGTAGAALTETEIKTLPVGAKLMTFEVGIRFLADYLNGDVYFKTKYPQHNLDRARNQFHLVQEMEEKWDEMMAVVEAYL
ncbi:MAG: aminoglycoside phosphotransferase family protein [Clostridia bacterium]|nr:aminoglycoside phosphotransferase family protein [Clostridia bacterium]